jgi:hypothetical protein
VSAVPTTAQCRSCGAILSPFERVFCERVPCRRAAVEQARKRVAALPEAERLLRARTALMNKARRALVDPVDFFELVLRDEATNKRVTVPPHQRVLLSFIMHEPHMNSGGIVIILPVGTGKTATCSGLGLFLLAQNPTLRGMFVSATQEQAKKPLMLLRQTLEASAELRLINPKLLPTRRRGEPWSDTAITVDRPYGIRDPSFVARGIESDAIQGSRIDFAIVDDLLNAQNTETPEQRDATYRKFFAQVANRIEPKPNSKLIVLNTTWHTEDYVNRLAKRWPTLRMSVTGDVFVANADDDWEPPELYVVGHKTIQGVVTEHCRLSEHHPDPRQEVPLWPARYSLAEIERQKAKYIHAPGLFKKFFLSEAHDDETALCKQEFIDRCKAKARAEGIFKLAPTYAGDMATFTGVDLAWTPDKKGGQTSFFTFGVSNSHAVGITTVCQVCANVLTGNVGEAKPDACPKCKAPRDQLVELLSESYVILDIESGHWDALAIIGKLFAKVGQFRSYAAIENNATQELLIQVARSMGKELPIRSHNTTQQGKAHPWQGVIGVFWEMGVGRWRIPNDMEGNCPEPVQHFVDACQSYTPTRHTSDVLMASYVARSLAMELGWMNSEPEAGPGYVSQERRAMRR